MLDLICFFITRSSLSVESRFGFELFFLWYGIQHRSIDFFLELRIALRSRTKLLGSFGLSDRRSRCVTNWIARQTCQWQKARISSVSSFVIFVCMSCWIVFRPDSNSNYCSEPRGKIAEEQLSSLYGITVIPQTILRTVTHHYMVLR